MSDLTFENFDKLSQAFSSLKRRKILHPVVEKRLALLLQDIYPDAYPQPEPGEMPGGRSDLAFYFGSGRYAIFEIFATVSQVAQDLRHLEQSNAQARIAILTDPVLDGGRIFEEYFHKRPRDPFPWMKLGDILVLENEVEAKEQLKQHIDEAFASCTAPLELAVDIASRLRDYGLSDTSDPNFGVSNLTTNLLQFVRNYQELGQEIETRPAASSTVFSAIPVAPLKSDSSYIFKTARELFDVNRWYHSWGRAEEKNPARYHSYAVFPLGNAKVRTEQKEVVIEEKPPLPEPRNEFVNFALRINESGEVSFATSYYTVDQFTEDVKIFRLGATIHLFWSFLCLVWDFQKSLGYVGNNHVCLAMVNTRGSYLGHFAKGWPDTYKIVLGGRFGCRELNEFCHNSNILICREIDLSTFGWKVEPEILYDMAEEIARAYNQSEARCFDRETRKLPADLWIKR